MKTAVRILMIIAVSTVVFGCSRTGGQPQRSKAELKAAAAIDKDLALKYLHGVQDGDKKKMYEAANLTTDIVKECREKLIHIKQNKLTENKRLECEHALRISGNIDFIAAKMIKMLPKSASFQITQTTPTDLPDGTRKAEHSVRVTYSNKEDAVHDKTGKPVKELVLPLLQISRSVNGLWIHDFSFNSKDFEKIANKDFEVLSYF